MGKRGEAAGLFEFELPDHAGSLYPNTLAGKVRVTDAGFLEIQLEGYGEKTAAEGHGAPIVIELFGGKPVVRVFGFINDEEPTHTIDLSGAAEALYNG